MIPIALHHQSTSGILHWERLCCSLVAFSPVFNSSQMLLSQRMLFLLNGSIFSHLVHPCLHYVPWTFSSQLHCKCPVHPELLVFSWYTMHIAWDWPYTDEPQRDTEQRDQCSYTSYLCIALGILKILTTRNHFIFFPFFYYLVSSSVIPKNKLCLTRYSQQCLISYAVSYYDVSARYGDGRSGTINCQ